MLASCHKIPQGFWFQRKDKRWPAWQGKVKHVFKRDDEQLGIFLHPSSHSATHTMQPLWCLHSPMKYCLLSSPFARLFAEGPPAFGWMREVKYSTSTWLCDWSWLIDFNMNFLDAFDRRGVRGWRFGRVMWCWYYYLKCLIYSGAPGWMLNDILDEISSLLRAFLIIQKISNNWDPAW